MRTLNKMTLWLSGFIVVTLLNGCKNDNDEKEQDEEELITTVTITLTDVAGIKPNVTATWKDVDGTGGNAPTIDTLRLLANTTYNAYVSILNESVNPAVNISAEVKEEGKNHLLCFEINGINATVIRNDSDGKYEIGLDSKWTVGAASTGTSKITLKHQPDVKNGECSAGETDVEVIFPIKIQ